MDMNKKEKKMKIIRKMLLKSHKYKGHCLERLRGKQTPRSHLLNMTNSVGSLSHSLIF